MQVTKLNEKVNAFLVVTSTPVPEPTFQFSGCMNNDHIFFVPLLDLFHECTTKADTQVVSLHKVSFIQPQSKVNIIIKQVQNSKLSNILPSVSPGFLHNTQSKARGKSHNRQNRSRKSRNQTQSLQWTLRF